MWGLRVLALATTTLIAMPAAAELPAWMLQGERITLTMSWLGITGGTMVLEAHQPAGEPTYRIAMRATSSAFVSKIIEIDDRFETRIDPDRVTAIISTQNNREGKRTLDERVEFDPVAGTARRWKNGRERDLLTTPAPVMDTLGAIYLIRTLPLAAGKTFTLTVQSGNKVYPMQVAVLERKMVKTEIGRLDAFIIEPRFAEGGLFSSKGASVIWVTAEAPHTLLRISSELPFGSLVASLTKVERPWAGVVESGRGSGGGAKQDGSQTR
jgi:hypothetical protein